VNGKINYCLCKKSAICLIVGLTVFIFALIFPVKAKAQSTRPSLCKSASISVDRVGRNTSFTITSTAKSANILKFHYIFYNKENPYPDNGTPQGFCVQNDLNSNGQQNTCPQGSHLLTYVDKFDSPRDTNTHTFTFNDVYFSDSSWGNNTPKSIQVNAYFSDEASNFSLPEGPCVVSFTIDDSQVQPPSGDVSSESLKANLKDLLSGMAKTDFDHIPGLTIDGPDGEVYSTWADINASSKLNDEEKAIYRTYMLCGKPISYRTPAPVNIVSWQEDVYDQVKCYAAANGMQMRLLTWKYLQNPTNEVRNALKSDFTRLAYLAMISHDKGTASRFRGDTKTIANLWSYAPNSADLLLGDTSRARRYLLDNYVGTGKGIGYGKFLGLLDDVYCSYLEGWDGKCVNIDLNRRMIQIINKIYDIKSMEGFLNPFGSISSPGVGGWGDGASSWQVSGVAIASAMNGDPDFADKKQNSLNVADVVYANSIQHEEGNYIAKTGYVVGNAHVGYFQHIATLLVAVGFDLNRLPNLRAKADELVQHLKNTYWWKDQPIFKVDKNSYDESVLSQVPGYAKNWIGNCGDSGKIMNRSKDGSSLVGERGEPPVDSVLGSFPAVYLFATNTGNSFANTLGDAANTLINIRKQGPLDPQIERCGPSWYGGNDLISNLRQFAYLEEVYSILDNVNVGQFTSGVFLDGDIDLDHKVDIKDYLLLSSTYGKRYGDLNYYDSADIKNDEVVDQQDYSVLSAEFGASN